MNSMYFDLDLPFLEFRNKYDEPRKCFFFKKDALTVVSPLHGRSGARCALQVLTMRNACRVNSSRAHSLLLLDTNFNLNVYLQFERIYVWLFSYCKK